MRRAVRSSVNETNPQLSHAINLFLHKDRTSFFDDDSIASGSIAPFDPQPPLAEPPSFNWDLQYSCIPLIPAFQYISDKLHQRELSVALIISEQEPFVIPVWPLPRKSQIILAQIVRRAVKKFSLETSWLTALASASNKRLPRIFEAYQPDSYIVRRSIVQNEVIFSGEGLTLLTIDHVYTLKQLLCTLSKKDWVPQARNVCLSSCVHLLRHINQVYTDPKVSSGYLARVYKEIDYQKEFYKEVSAAYDINYCTASIKDVTTLEPNITALSDMRLDYEIESENELESEHRLEAKHELEAEREPKPTFVAELPDSSPHQSTQDLISPVATIEMSAMESCQTPHPEESLNIISPLTVRYPTIQRQPSQFPESPLDPDAPWNAPIPPTLSTKRASTIPATPSQSSHREAEAWLATLPNPLDMTASWPTHISAPLQTIESSMRSSNEPKSAFEFVKTWVESWSTVAPRVLCENCHEVAAVQPLLPRRFTMK